MTGKRLSKRDSSVTKRKKLEDKLKKKAEEAKKKQDPRLSSSYKIKSFSYSQKKQ